MGLFGKTRTVLFILKIILTILWDVARNPEQHRQAHREMKQTFDNIEQCDECVSGALHAGRFDALCGEHFRELFAMPGLDGIEGTDGK